MSVGDISRRQANTREISDIFHFTASYTFSAGTTFSHGINIYIAVCSSWKIGCMSNASKEDM